MPGPLHGKEIFDLWAFNKIMTAWNRAREGGQWLSGRVLDSRPRVPGFEPHRCHCVVSLSKTH